MQVRPQPHRLRERGKCVFRNQLVSGCWRLSAVSGWKKWLRSLQCCTRNLVQSLCLPQLPVFCMEDTDLSANTCRLLAVVWQWSCGKCGATFTLKANVLRYQFESDFFFLWAAAVIKLRKEIFVASFLSGNVHFSFGAQRLSTYFTD